MLTLRTIAAGCALLTLYYARFFLFVRQEASTLIQIGLLLIAAAVLVVPMRHGQAGSAWFRHWWPTSPGGWATLLAALGLAVAIFLWADHDAHSVSDTLNRSVPALCLILATVLRVAYQQDERRNTSSTV